MVNSQPKPVPHEAPRYSHSGRRRPEIDSAAKDK